MPIVNPGGMWLAPAPTPRRGPHAQCPAGGKGARCATGRWSAHQRAPALVPRAARRADGDREPRAFARSSAPNCCRAVSASRWTATRFRTQGSHLVPLRPHPGAVASSPKSMPSTRSCARPTPAIPTSSSRRAGNISAHGDIWDYLHLQNESVGRIFPAAHTRDGLLAVGEEEPAATVFAPGPSIRRSPIASNGCCAATCHCSIFCRVRPAATRCGFRGRGAPASCAGARKVVPMNR